MVLLNTVDYLYLCNLCESFCWTVKIKLKQNKLSFKLQLLIVNLLIEDGDYFGVERTRNLSRGWDPPVHDHLSKQGQRDQGGEPGLGQRPDPVPLPVRRAQQQTEGQRIGRRILYQSGRKVRRSVQPPVRHLPAARGRFQSARSGCDEAEDLGLRHLPESWRRTKLLVRGDVAEEQPVDLSRSSRSIHSQDRRGSSESQLRYRHPQVYLITFNLMLKCCK